MGSCSSKPQQQPFHERLDEYDDAYFERVETRNSFDRKSSSKWWRKYKIRKEEEGSPLVVDDHDYDDGDSNQSNHNNNNNSNSNQRYHTRPSSSMETNVLFLSPTSRPTTASTAEVTSPTISSPAETFNGSLYNQNNADERHVKGWQVKRKGRALQLRLAKHRFLQLAVTQQNDEATNLISPLSLDSVFSTSPLMVKYEIEEQHHNKKATSHEQQFQLSTDSQQKDTNIKFDSSKGMIWKEIIRDYKVTALAISHTPIDQTALQSSTKVYPLILAMGDDAGNIVVTLIVDDALMSSGLRSSDTIPNSPMDLPSDALEFSVEGRIRSLDFGSQNYLVAGGDGCCAWVLQIAFDGPTKRLKALVPIYQLQRVDRIYAVRFSPDCSFLAVGGFDGKTAIVPMISLWRRDSGDDKDDDSLQELMQNSIIELTRPGLINCLDFSPPGNYLAVGSNKICGVYDATSFQLIHETEVRSATRGHCCMHNHFLHQNHMLSHQRRLTTIQALQFNNSGSFLAIGDRDVVILEGTPPFKTHCEISNAPNDSNISQFRYRITSLCWSPSGSFLAVAGSDGVCLVVETKGYALVHQIERTDSIHALAWGQHRSLNGNTRQYLAVSDDACNVALIKTGTSSQGADHTDDHSSAASSSHVSSSANTDWVLRDDAFCDVEDVATPFLPEEIKSQANITAVAFSRRKN
jgi:WD40 repeat protein